MNSVHFKSDKDNWETPTDLFTVLDREFHFEWDVAADPINTKCKRYYTPEDNGLAQEWQGVCWLNPPYGNAIAKWMRKAFESASVGSATVVCLVPSRTDTKWWWNHAQYGEIRFLPGRLKFVGAENSAPFPSAVVIFRHYLWSGGYAWHWDWRAKPAEAVAIND
jgi:phage N-6-adenine-methyltransferase